MFLFSIVPITIRRICATLVLLSLGIIRGQTQITGDAVCSTGTCINIKFCPELLPRPGQRLTYQQAAQLRNLLCGYEGINAKVCCSISVATLPTTPSPVTRVTTLPSNCGFAGQFDKIYGGHAAPLGANPWMVAIEYHSTWSTSKPSIQCGASLITAQHVLTAAHCVHPSSLNGYRVTELRIGEWDTSTDPDCQVVHSNRFCVEPVVKRKPSTITWHPKYNISGNNDYDIALIRLDQPVQFGPFIQPICIPDSFDPNKLDLNTHPRAIITGWGLQESGELASVLQELRLPFVNISICNDTWQGRLNDHQLCAGGEEGRDSCRGDSGGPLITTGYFGPPFKLVGLTSFGTFTCGLKDRYGVYTSVSAFKTWIVDNLVQ